MLRLVVPDFVGTRRPVLPEPFIDRVPDFFAYLRDERGLRAATIWQYTHHLRQFAVYLREHGLHDLRALSPVVISGFQTDRSRHLSRSSVRSRCVVLRVFLRYLDTTNRYAEITTRAKLAAVQLCEPVATAADSTRRGSIWRDDQALLSWLASL